MLCLGKVWNKFSKRLGKGWVKVGIRFGAVPNKNKKHIVFFYKKIKGVIGNEKNSYLCKTHLIQTI